MDSPIITRRWSRASFSRELVGSFNVQQLAVDPDSLRFGSSRTADLARWQEHLVYHRDLVAMSVVVSVDLIMSK